MAEDFASQVRGVSALADPARLTLYRYVLTQPDPVSRDQAAAGTGLPRHNVKFHLDKLVDEGLLVTEFRRLSGRRGPGAGRTAKLYRRSARQVAVTVPERHYDLAGQILAQAVEDAAASGTPVLDAVQRAAVDAGASLAARSQQHAGERAEESTSAVTAVATTLAAHGYEPQLHGDTLVLANCPFHALAREHVALVCGMNLDLIGAMLEGMGWRDVVATLDPGPNRCCVTLCGRPQGDQRSREASP
jgi:predicted ArsR family transcriptional regulator